MSSQYTNKAEEVPLTKLEHATFAFNTENGETQEIPVYVGGVIFVIGPNGSGKSSMLQKLYTDNRNWARRITAHRQTWLQSNASDLAPAQKVATDQQIAAQDRQDHSRWQDQLAAHRVSVTIFDLVDAEHARARAITAAVDTEDEPKKEKLKQQPSPLSRLNFLLRVGNLPIDISIGSDQRLFAKKEDSDLYSIAELSDGERNAVLLAAKVLTAPHGTLILIDEPERHLHRSIASPLLISLFEERQDCAFVISTHDVSLPTDIPSATTLLLRSCMLNGQKAKAWDVDIIDTDAGISDEIRFEILGARRKILFVEGEASSTDYYTYSILYPDVSVIPKANCTEVERTVTGIRNSEELHWVKAYGLIDRDNREEEVKQLSERGIFALDCYSVESLYYSSAIMERIAERQLEVSPDIANLPKAKESIIVECSKHKARLCSMLIEKRVRNDVASQLPTHQSLLQTPVHCIKFDSSSLLSGEKEKFDSFASNEDTDGLIKRYSVATTGALAAVAKHLGFHSREKYESAVRKLLVDNKEVRNILRQRLSSLSQALKG